MVKRLVAAYLEVNRSPYAFTGKDAKAVQRLLALTPDDDEIERRWREAMTRKYGGCSGLPMFASRFNEYVPRPEKPVTAGTAADWKVPPGTTIVGTMKTGLAPGEDIGL
jgi:hypothetical protein